MANNKQQPELQNKSEPINDTNDAKHDGQTYTNGQQNILSGERKANVLLEAQPWKILYQNIRCLVSENSKKKIEYFREFTTINDVLILNLTETWLDETIDDDAKINGYKEYRSDRIGIKQGGTIIYTNDELESEVLAKISINKCEMIAINILTLNTINIVVYRPPHTKREDFYIILNKIEEILSGMENPNPIILMTGDFNFPFIR